MQRSLPKKVMEKMKWKERKGRLKGKQGMAKERGYWSPRTQQWIRQLAGDANSAL